MRIFAILGEQAQQIEDLMVKEFLKVVSGNLDTDVEVCGLLELNKFLDLFKLLLNSVNSRVLKLLSHKRLRLFDIKSGVVGSINKDSVEDISSPLDAMLNLRGEVSESAHGNGFFRRILGITVALSHVRDHHLRVGLSAKCARLKERLLVPNATLINVKTSIDVINCVDDKAEALPE
jgi:hypothetical protein